MLRKLSVGHVSVGRLAGHDCGLASEARPWPLPSIHSSSTVVIVDIYAARYSLNRLSTCPATDPDTSVALVRGFNDSALLSNRLNGYVIFLVILIPGNPSKASAPLRRLATTTRTISVALQAPSHIFDENQKLPPFSHPLQRLTHGLLTRSVVMGAKPGYDYQQVVVHQGN